MPRKYSKPVWLLVIIIIAALPVAFFPTMLELINPADETAKAMAWLYVVYVFLTSWLAWVCWPERKTVTWVLLLLLVMSHAAMWGLALLER